MSVNVNEKTTWRAATPGSEADRDVKRANLTLIFFYFLVVWGAGFAALDSTLFSIHRPNNI